MQNVEFTALHVLFVCEYNVCLSVFCIQEMVEFQATYFANTCIC